MADTKQTNFAGGELSPLLWGRTDLPVFAKGCRTLENFLVTKHGAALTRPGTTFVNQTKNPPSQRGIGTESGPGAPKSLPLVGFDAVRLLPFNVADDESFCLEVGPSPGAGLPGYIRFHTLGATVLKGDGTPYEVATPYTEADIPLLKWAQIGEVLTICSPNWDPYELRHISDSPPNWSFTAAVTKPVAAGFPISLGLQMVDFAVDRNTLVAVDPDHPAKEWLWKVTVVLKRTDTGETFETLPSDVVNSFNAASSYTTTKHALTTDVPNNQVVLYPDKPIALYHETDGSVIASSIPYSFVAFNYYRGRGSLFGFVGTTTSSQFIDVGDTPNYAIQPPAGRTPFGTVETPNVFIDSSGAQTDLHTQRPSAVCYFQQRRVFGGLHTADREQDLEISALNNFDDYDEHNLIDVPGEALQVTLAARRRGSIRHLVSMRRMIILGSASSTHGGGTSQLPLDFNAMDFPLIEEVGAADIQPLVVDGSCLFIRAMNRGARALIPSQDGYNYEGTDITWAAEHLFRGMSNNILDWTHAQEPWDVVWAVRADGTMLSLTFDRNQQMIAWAHHEFGSVITPAVSPPDAAYVQSVCAVREGDEDAVYLIVNRGVGLTLNRYVERMTSRHARGGAQTGSPGPYAAPAGLSVPPDYICLDSAIPYVGAAAQVFTGLGTLEGRQVYILAQGSPPDGPYTVTGGQITAAAQYTENVTASDGTKKLVLYIGLPYECTMELLDIAGAEARARWKQVTHVGVEVDQSKGLKFSQDGKTFDDQPPRDVTDDYGPSQLITDFVWVPVAGTFDQSARAVIKQTLPLPTTCVGVLRRLSVGG